MFTVYGLFDKLFKNFKENNLNISAHTASTTQKRAEPVENLEAGAVVRGESPAGPNPGQADEAERGRVSGLGA